MEMNMQYHTKLIGPNQFSRHYNELCIGHICAANHLYSVNKIYERHDQSGPITVTYASASKIRMLDSSMMIEYDSDGEPHGHTEKPAITLKTHMFWGSYKVVNGKFHSLDGPAYTSSNEVEKFYVFGKRCRTFTEYANALRHYRDTPKEEILVMALKWSHHFI